MEGLLGHSRNVLNSAADHFVSSKKFREERYFRLTRFGCFANLGIRIVAVINLSQSVSQTYFVTEHLLFKITKTFLLYILIEVPSHH